MVIFGLRILEAAPATGDVVEYTAPSGKVFTAKVISREYDDSVLADDGAFGAWLVTANVWYERGDGLPGVMRRVIPETDITRILQRNAA